jgi:WD40 repeat protein
VTAVAFGPEARRALSAGYDGQVLLWDLETGKPVEGFSFGGAKYVNDVSFSPGGRQALVCAGRVVYLIDPRTGKVLRKLEGHSAWVVQGVFSGDGKRVLTAADDSTARLWDAGTGRPVQVFRGHAEPLAAVAFAGKGREALSVSRDASVRSWRITKLVAAPPPEVKRACPPAGERVREVVRPLGMVPVGGTVGSLLLSPDRKALYYLDLTAGALGRVDTRALRRDRLLRLAEGTDAVALTPDGKALYVGAVGSNDVQKFDTTTGIATPIAVNLKNSSNAAVAPDFVGVRTR